MSKCNNCAIMAKMNECDEACVCVWYMDNVVCGNKRIEDCTAFEEKESEDTE